jgi:spore maturation protein CgeB
MKKARETIVLITGGAGFIGTNLADRLALEGYRVRIFDNLSRAGVEQNIDWLLSNHADQVEFHHAAGIEFRGWIPNFRVPKAFAAARATVHVPRRPYVKALPGIPTIRPFEALACGIPLVSSFWSDREGLLTAGKDYLVAHDGKEMKQHLAAILSNDGLAHDLAAQGLETIRARHTCAHRVNQLLEIHDQLRL